jgi:hypothetical protein
LKGSSRIREASLSITATTAGSRAAFSMTRISSRATPLVLRAFWMSGSR